MSVVNRERRKNAGKRMAILGKKMAEEDEAFWSHETWADDDSGNESFHESDEDSALQKDVFDSDFNDSESDNEDEEVAAGEAEERELRKSERALKSAYKQPGLKRRRGFGVGKRVLGEGFNAGIVLNLPPESHDSLAYLESLSASRNALLASPQQTQQSTPIATTTVTKPIALSEPLAAPPIAPAAPPPQPPPKVTIKAKDKPKPVPVRKQTRASKASLTERRSTRGKAPKIQAAPSRKASSDRASDSDARAKRKRYAQEELLLEAVHDTEPENQRWLHGRKRVQDQHNLEKDLNAGLRDRYRGKKIVQKFHSRRGCLITLTFPEMDAVPEILTRRNENPPPTSPLPASSLSQQTQSSRCVITGKAGKYKDPLTKHTYHDLAAFRELRRRHKEGIPIVIRPVVTKEVTSDSTVTKKTATTATRKKKVVKKKTSAGNVKNTVAVKKEETSKAPSTTVTDLSKLPFQSPKPPSRPATNGGSTHTNAIAIPIHLQQPSKGTASPPSPRRLSARKRKPSEKVLETISNDGIAPRGLGIQPKLPPAPMLSSQPAPVVATSSLSTAALSRKLKQPDASLSSSTKVEIPSAQKPTMKSLSSDSPNIVATSNTGDNGKEQSKPVKESSQANSVAKTTDEETAIVTAKTEATVDANSNNSVLGQGGEIKGKTDPMNLIDAPKKQ